MGIGNSKCKTRISDRTWWLRDLPLGGCGLGSWGICLCGDPRLHHDLRRHGSHHARGPRHRAGHNGLSQETKSYTFNAKTIFNLVGKDNCRKVVTYL